MDMTEAYTDKPVQEQVSTSVLAYDVTFCIIFITNLKKFFRVWSCMYGSTFLIFYCTVFYSTGDLHLLFNSHGNQKHGLKLGEFMLSFKVITISKCAHGNVYLCLQL